MLTIYMAKLAGVVIGTIEVQPITADYVVGNEPFFSVSVQTQSADDGIEYSHGPPGTEWGQLFSATLRLITQRLSGVAGLS